MIAESTFDDVVAVHFPLSPYAIEKIGLFTPGGRRKERGS